MTHVFTYGTLEIPEVMETVTGRSLASAEAWAKGFAKFLLKGRIYPGMTALPGAICSGRVYYHIDRRTLEILDAFEDEVYTPAKLFTGKCWDDPCAGLKSEEIANIALTKCSAQTKIPDY